MVAESGLFGLARLGGPLPPLPSPLFGEVAVVVVAAGAVPLVAGIGEVIAGIETVGWVVSPELSPPQPEASRPIAMDASASAPITWSRRAPAGEARNTGSR